MRIKLEIDGVYRSAEFVEENPVGTYRADKKELLKMLESIYRQTKVWIIDAE